MNVLLIQLKRIGGLILTVPAIAAMCCSVTPFIDGESRILIADRSVRKPW